MHDIEPHFHWRNEYISSEDEKSPFYGRTNSEFQYTNKVYNYYIHPQWDAFGSSTLYMKILFIDYEEGYAIFEMMGEWNDCLHNDVMFLKREIIDELSPAGINKFILICENVLNFHGEEDSYYEEWYDDIKEENGWVVFINTLDHVADELTNTRLEQYIHFGPLFNNITWRPQKPKRIFAAIEGLLQQSTKRVY